MTWVESDSAIRPALRSLSEAGVYRGVLSRRSLNEDESLQKQRLVFLRHEVCLAGRSFLRGDWSFWNHEMSFFAVTWQGSSSNV